MNFPQSATVDGLDYEKLIDSRFVTMVIAHQMRTNRAIGINQDGYHAQGLRALRASLIIGEMSTPEYWQATINDCLMRVKSLMALAESGKHDNPQSLIDEANDLCKLAELSYEQLESLNG